MRARRRARAGRSTREQPTRSPPRVSTSWPTPCARRAPTSPRSTGAPRRRATRTPSPPARRRYGDDRVEAANAAAHRARCRPPGPMLVGAGPRGRPGPRPGGVASSTPGPPVEWGLMCGPQRNAVRGACVLEGWAVRTTTRPGPWSSGGDVRLASRPRARRGGRDVRRHLPRRWRCGRPATRSAAAWAQPLNDGPGEAFWLGVRLPGGDRRQRVMAEGIAPGFAAALRATGRSTPSPSARRPSRWATTATCATRPPPCCCCARRCPPWRSARPRACCRRRGCSPPTATSP